MDVNNLKPNSHRYKEEQKNAPIERPKVEKVVTGTAKIKKNEMRKLADVFIAEDVSNVKSYILMDVLVPAFKKLIADIVTDGIDMVLYGSTGRRRSGTGSTSRAGYVDYSGISSGRRYDDRRRDEQPRRDIRHYEDVTVETRGEAEEVLRRMDELMETYRVVRVADFFDLVGLPCEYTDNNYGWTNIRNAEVVRDRSGRYAFKLPRALPIDR